MAQQYPPNVMLPETRAASDRVHALSAAAGVIEIRPRSKYRDPGSGKNMGKKISGNSGKTGRKHRSFMRGHSGGKETLEQKHASEAQSRAFVAWRQSWTS